MKSALGGLHVRAYLLSRADAGRRLLLPRPSGLGATAREGREGSLARKELKKEIEPIRKLVAAQRREIAALKKSLATGARHSPAPARPKAQVDVANASDSRLRFIAKGFRTHRTRLGLSAEDMGVLIGVSGATVYNWEQGKSSPRQRQLPAIAAVRGIGKKAALVRLEALKSAPSNP